MPLYKSKYVAAIMGFTKKSCVWLIFMKIRREVSQLNAYVWKQWSLYVSTKTINQHET